MVISDKGKASLGRSKIKSKSAPKAKEPLKNKEKIVKKAVVKASLPSIKMAAKEKIKPVEKKPFLQKTKPKIETVNIVQAAPEIKKPAAEIKKPPVQAEVKKPHIEIKKHEPVKIFKKPVHTFKEKKHEVKPRPEAAKVEVKPVPVIAEKKIEKLVDIEVEFPMNVKDLSVKMGEKPSNLIKWLMERKILVNLNQSLDDEVAKSLAHHFGFGLKPAPSQEERLLAEHFVQTAADLKPRQPVVTFMGHVDHGKTSLLDYIRKSNHAEEEHGGITQHIGAYEVVLKKGKITFLDTPGHEAFTAMRSRGANVTDIVVLVVAADDGIMPQTIEAINHAKAANVPIVVAVNKVDKAPENVDTVKRQLIKYELTAEDLGGKTITVPVSAKTGQGMDDLLELILLESELLELKADFSKPASGVIIEANLSKGRGVEATVLVQQGILRRGDIVLVEDHFGRIKAMFDSFGKLVQEAVPAMPVKLLGLSGVPQAGQKFYCITDEKLAKEIVLKRQQAKQKQRATSRTHITLEELHARIKEGIVKELGIILKADVQGSVEALQDSLIKLGTDEVKIKVVHAAAGAINSSDVVLAAASDAVIIGFHVEADEQAKDIARKEGVEIRTYRIIYEAINELKAALEGLLEPTIRRTLIGRILVKKMFDLTRSGKVAGCIVEKGKVSRHNQVALIRNEEKLFEGKIANLKRFKDDVREVSEGMDCGITLDGFKTIQEGDIIEAFEEERIARKL